MRREIYILFFGRIVTNLGAMIWPMLTMILNQKMGLDASGIAIFFVASGAIMLPANLIGGKLADKFNKKRNIVVFDGISIACYIVCALIPISYGSVVLMTLAGIFQSMEYPSYNALIADLTVTKDRDRAYSLQYLGSNLGLVLSPTIAGLLFKNYLWAAFLISGISIGISTLLILFKVRDITPVDDTDAAAVYQTSRASDGLFKILRENKILVIYIIAMALYGAAYSQYNYLMPLDMGTVHGENGAVIFGTVSSLNCIIVVLFTPLITRIFARVTDVKKILIGELLVTVGYAVFLTFLGHIPVYYVSIILFTWGEIFSTISDAPYVSNRVPATHRGRINGFSAVLGSIIQGAAELSVGHVYDGVGSFAAWIIVIGMLGLGMILTAWLIKKDRKTYPALYEQKPKPDAPVETEKE